MKKNSIFPHIENVIDDSEPTERFYRRASIQTVSYFLPHMLEGIEHLASSSPSSLFPLNEKLSRSGQGAAIGVSCL
jgi:hypothetical protein